MIKLFVQFALLFSTLLFSSPSFAEWKFVSSTVRGAKYYVDFDRIQIKQKYIYYWELTDYASEDGYGYLSDITKVVVDCDLQRFQNLQVTNYKGAMGSGVTTGYGKPSSKWLYPPPNTIKETMVFRMCKLIN